VRNGNHRGLARQPVPYEDVFKEVVIIGARFFAAEENAT
jgi:hypothetical protein